MRRVLITGGAGFIGAHLSRELLAAGWTVRALDDLNPQVHGEVRRRPAHLDREVELMRGDVRDLHAVARALEGVDAVVHLAALVGVGQSMYQITDYTSVNSLGTAVLLEQLSRRPVGRLVVASSMSVYGEGLYQDARGRIRGDVERDLEAVERGQFDPRGGEGETLAPLPTDERKPPSLSSVYALGKLDQERLCLMLARAYGMEAVALRLFNVYGPHQSLSNPYTGVLAIFAARLLNDNPPLVFEDGMQRRDFVAVEDAARAFRLALEARDVSGRVFNIGSGRAVTVREVAERMAAACRKALAPVITRRYRSGDVRHCFADISQARVALGYTPQVAIEEGLLRLAAWLEGQVVVDRIEQTRAEIDARGLVL